MGKPQMAKSRIRDRPHQIRGRHLVRLPLYLFLLVAVLTAIVFLIAGMVMKGGFELAWEILLGIHTPFGDESALGVALSALGYLAVPTIIGLVVAEGITSFIEYRLPTVEEAAMKIADRVKPKIKEALEEAAEEVRPASAEPPKEGK
jgi:hypothetical protein